MGEISLWTEWFVIYRLVQPHFIRPVFRTVYTLFALKTASELRSYSHQLCTNALKTSRQIWDFTIFSSVWMHSRHKVRFEILLSLTLYEYYYFIRTKICRLCFSLAVILVSVVLYFLSVRIHSILHVSIKILLSSTLYDSNKYFTSD